MLRSAAVIEASQLGVEDIEEYLRRCLGTIGGSWPELFAKLSQGPIRDALTTPLRLWLLRKVYIDRKRDPSDLCHEESAAAIRDSLLDSLVEALIEADRELQKSDDGGAVGAIGNSKLVTTGTIRMLRRGLSISRTLLTAH